MSIEIIANQIFKFLGDSTPEVIAIKGGWGVGKTFAWKKFLKEAKDRKSISFNHYSYVSLFGVNSLDVLKTSIFENSVKTTLIGTSPSIQTIKENTLDIGTSMGFKSVRFFKGMPILKHAANMLDSLSFMYIREHIICIDDIERKGAALSSGDILGIISLLKEQKNCKVVILLNDSNKGNLDSYDELREKVIDREISFNPSSEECVNISVDSSLPKYEDFKKLIILLNINNIRTIKKAERQVKECLDLGLKIEPEVLYQLVHTIILFTASHYRTSLDESIPDIDFITSESFYSVATREEDDSKKEIYKNWNLTLNEYGFTSCDELDRVILEIVKSGFVVESALDSAVKVQNIRAISQRNEKSFNAAWRLYHDSFDDNLDEVVDQMYHSAMSSMPTISLSNLSSTIEFLVDSGEPKKAKALEDEFIRYRKQNDLTLDSDDLNPFDTKLNCSLLKRLDDEKVNMVNKESIVEVLLRVSQSKSWSDLDIAILSDGTSDDFYKAFKSIKGAQLTPAVTFCLKYGAVRKAEEALIKIARENNLNRRRIVHKYKISIPDE